jgi:hypothetical protein
MEVIYKLLWNWKHWSAAKIKTKFLILFQNVMLWSAVKQLRDIWTGVFSLKETAVNTCCSACNWENSYFVINISINFCKDLYKWMTWRPVVWTLRACDVRYCWGVGGAERAASRHRALRSTCGGTGAGAALGARSGHQPRRWERRLSAQQSGRPWSCAVGDPGLSLHNRGGKPETVT